MSDSRRVRGKECIHFGRPTCCVRAARAICQARCYSAAAPPTLMGTVLPSAPIVRRVPVWIMPQPMSCDKEWEEGEERGAERGWL